MTDGLVKRLRSIASGVYVADEAADEIERLEAKLAWSRKEVETLEQDVEWLWEKIEELEEQK